MKAKIIINTLILICAMLVMGMLQSTVRADNESPSFNNHHVNHVYEGRHVSIKFTSPMVLKYRNQLQDTENQKVNFAGHYIISPMRCGDECVILAIIDSATGRVYMPQPYDEYTRGKNKILNWTFLDKNRKIICYTDSNFAHNQISFTPNSNLLILAVNYHKDHSLYPGKILFYVWEDNKLFLIKSITNSDNTHKSKK